MLLMHSRMFAYMFACYLTPFDSREQDSGQVRLAVSVTKLERREVLYIGEDMTCS